MIAEVIKVGCSVDYQGGFRAPLDKIIERTAEKIGHPILHLYSGRSKIGDERIDLATKEATINTDVGEYLKQKPKQRWRLVLLDPPYAIQSADKKLTDYASITPLSANVPRRQQFTAYCRKYVDNILWLDQCAPIFTPFKREKLWLILGGGYCTVRVLSWLSAPSRLEDFG